jgi:hypothetical protein
MDPSERYRRSPAIHSSHVDKHRADESDDRGGVGEDAHDPGAALDLLVEAPQV